MCVRVCVWVYGLQNISYTLKLWTDLCTVLQFFTVRLLNIHFQSTSVINYGKLKQVLATDVFMCAEVYML